MANDRATIGLWETRARWHLDRFASDFQRVEPLLGVFAPAPNGRIVVEHTFSFDDAARIAASSELLDIGAGSVLERALATQWHLDKRLSAGAEIILRGPGSVRRRLDLPLTPGGEVIA